MLEKLRTKCNKKNRSEIHARNYIFLNYVEVKFPSKHVQNSLKKIYQKSKEKNLRKKRGPKDFFIRTCLNYVEEKKEKKKTKRKKATLKKPPNFPCQKKQRALNFAYQNFSGSKNSAYHFVRGIRVYSWLSFVEWETGLNYVVLFVEREAGRNQISHPGQRAGQKPVRGRQACGPPPRAGQKTAGFPRKLGPAHGQMGARMAPPGPPAPLAPLFFGFFFFFSRHFAGCAAPGGPAAGRWPGPLQFGRGSFQV